MGKTKKKKGKKVAIAIIVIIIILIILGIWTRSRNKDQYDEITATTGDITSYYTFSGNVAAINVQNKLSQSSLTVSSVSVSEGKIVKKGDTIIKPTYGSNITAGQDGTVTKIYVQKDDTVMTGSPLFDIVDYNNLQTTVRVDEYDLSSIKVGEKVDVTIDALNKTVSGTISDISKEATSSNGVAYFTADIKLAKDSAVRVGMTTETKVVAQSAKNVVLIPMDAVQIDDQNKTYVNVRGDKNKVVTQYIETGVSDGTNVEVTSGLNSGDTILKPIVSASTTTGLMSMRNSSRASNSDTTGGSSNGQ
ncbi:MAG: efflux RND transporter periplasmic adaptor subunit [Oscillospiraceae bacterium]|nr:efflux RND transporter periplasmic adaptor subunit [Oscillospiraceae bacterium]